MSGFVKRGGSRMAIERGLVWNGGGLCGILKGEEWEWLGKCEMVMEKLSERGEECSWWNPTAILQQKSAK